MRNGPSPFSLFELLVSVGITVVLLAVLIPLLRTARMTAHRDQCRSNLKQLGDAWSAYLDDNGERFPFLAARPGWNYGGMRTARVTGTMSLDMRRPLNAYLTGSRSIFECPGDCGISHHEHRASGSTFEIFGTSYRLNANLVDARIAGVDEKGRGLHRSELRNVPASRLLLLGDTEWFESYEQTGRDATWHGDPGHGNLLFMDNSVQYRQVEPRGMTGPVVVEVSR